MTTAQDIIQDAYEKIGVYAPGQTVNAADGARGLSSLNDMMDSWSNENLACFAIVEQSLTFVVGKASYTIGTTGGADVPLTRPIRLIEGLGAAYAMDTNQNQYQMDVITRAEWNQRGSRNTNSNFPSVLFYDNQFPLGVLNFDPIPNIGYQAFWDSYLQLSDFAGLTTTFSLPPGYKLAISSNLALALKMYFTEAVASQDLKNQAAESKRVVKISNRRLNKASYDAEVLSRAPGTWDIYTSSYRRSG